jgi:hypothetical protein
MWQSWPFSVFLSFVGPLLTCAQASAQIQYINHCLNTETTFDKAQDLFKKFLRTSPCVELWTFYLNYVRYVWVFLSPNLPRLQLVWILSDGIMLETLNEMMFESLMNLHWIASVKTRIVKRFGVIIFGFSSWERCANSSASIFWPIYYDGPQACLSDSDDLILFKQHMYKLELCYYTTWTLAWAHWDRQGMKPWCQSSIGSCILFCMRNSSKQKNLRTNRHLHLPTDLSSAACLVFGVA